MERRRGQPGRPVGRGGGSPEIGGQPGQAAIASEPVDRHRRGSLDVSYVSDQYFGGAVSGFRVDPPPDGLAPIYSDTDALAAFHRVTGSRFGRPGLAVWARFGVYSGKMRVLRPDGMIGGRPDPRNQIPAWLVVVDGANILFPRPASRPGIGRARRGPLPGHVVQVIADGTGEMISDQLHRSGPFPGLSAPD